MDPLAAAEVVFEQSAAGEFYLLTQPDYVGSAMAERAAVLTSQEAAATAWRAPVRPRQALTWPLPQLDPDAAARVAAFGAAVPDARAWVRRRARRHRIRSPARGPADAWPRSSTAPHRDPPGPSRCASTDRPTSSTSPGAGVPPRRRNGHGQQPFIRTAGTLSRGTPAVPSSSPWSTDWRRSHHRPRSSTTPTPRPHGSPPRRRTGRRCRPTRRWSATAQAARWPPPSRWRRGTAPGRKSVRSGAAVSGPGSRHGCAVDHLDARRADAAPRRHRLHARARRLRDATARPLSSARLRRRSVRPSAGDRGDRRVRSDPRLGRTLCGAPARRGRADHDDALSR